MNKVPDNFVDLTPEQKRRQASGNDTAKGQKARRASPWSNGPMCNTRNGRQHFEERGGYRDLRQPSEGCTHDKRRKPGQ